MNVADIMTKHVECCLATDSLPTVATLMKRSDVGAIPIVERDTKKVIGIISDRDIVCRAVATGEDPKGFVASRAMTTPVVTVLPTTEAEECRRLFRDNLIRRLPVVDDQGRCVGMVALADIIRASSDSFSDTLIAETLRDVTHPRKIDSIPAA